MRFLKFAFFFLLLVVASGFTAIGQGFEDMQRHNPRVNEVYERKDELFKMKCRSLDIPDETFGNILIRFFKAEAIMEVWVEKADGKYIKFNEYKIYATSGKLGPKRQEGDCQAPEGYYYISDFNPNSNYYLSLGINYPNESDRVLSTAERKGGNIYIHGARVSAGCFAMSNYYIEDIYMCAVKARNNGQTHIPVEVFPFKPTAANLMYYNQFKDCKMFDRFWRNLAQGYQFFEKNRRPPEVSIERDGTYRFFDPHKMQAVSK